jgi:hypothetical protein
MMKVKWFSEAIRYDAPNHRRFVCLRQNHVATTLVVMPYPPA